MERRRLGTTEIDLPVIGMGTWRTFDTDEDRTPIVDEALAAGTDLFDSSPMYGKAEATLARALAGRRQEVRVASKIWTEDDDEGQRQADYAVAVWDCRHLPGPQSRQPAEPAVLAGAVQSRW
ncbi:MAG: aldo/keto reductase [Candidatus Dormibacteraeota bacterium]|nr:aldo/keto reductase [Candidatus Dormibacteraeota bacterium]